MIRYLVHGSVGVITGITIGIGIALVGNLSIIDAVIVGGIVGGSVGLVAAYRLNRIHYLGGKFLNKEQADALAYSIQLDLIGILPIRMAERIATKLRGIFERWTH